MSQMKRNNLFLLSGLIRVWVGVGVLALMSVCIWMPLVIFVRGVLREWMSVKACEFAQSSWGPQVRKSHGWISPCVDWWMGLRMRVILISWLLWLATSSTSEPSLHTYKTPMYMAPLVLSFCFSSPLFSFYSLPFSFWHIHTDFAAPAWEEERGQEVRGVIERGQKTKRRNERQMGGFSIAIWSVLRPFVAKESVFFLPCNSI